MKKPGFGFGSNTNIFNCAFVCIDKLKRHQQEQIYNEHRTLELPPPSSQHQMVLELFLRSRDNIVPGNPERADQPGKSEDG